MQIMETHAVSMFACSRISEMQYLQWFCRFDKNAIVKFCNNVIQNIKVLAKCAVIHVTKGQIKESKQWEWRHRKLACLC